MIAYGQKIFLLEMWPYKVNEISIKKIEEKQYIEFHKRDLTIYQIEPVDGVLVIGRSQAIN